MNKLRDIETKMSKGEFELLSKVLDDLKSARIEESCAICKHLDEFLLSDGYSKKWCKKHNAYCYQVSEDCKFYEEDTKRIDDLEKHLNSVEVIDYSGTNVPIQQTVPPMPKVNKKIYDTISFADTVLQEDGLDKVSEFLNKYNVKLIHITEHDIFFSTSVIRKRYHLLFETNEDTLQSIHNNEKKEQEEFQGYIRNAHIGSEE